MFLFPRFVLIFFLLLPLFTYCQLAENFDDGNFDQAPEWTGDTASFIVNGEKALQSNHTTEHSTFYLSTVNTRALTSEWKFHVRLDFSTSSANYADIWLIASLAELTNNANSGYFVRIGNTDDEISLYRKTSNNSPVKIIDGADKILGSSSDMLIKVTRDAGNNWTLHRDLTAGGDQFIVEGSIQDNSFQQSHYFGILIRQSSSSFFQKHFFDDISISQFIPDTEPPSISSVRATSATTLYVLLNESVDKMSAGLFSNYSVNGLGMPATAQLDDENSALVHLEYAAPFESGATYTLTINGVKDLQGNVMSNVLKKFFYYIAQRYDVVINEIFADPNPSQGLPDEKFIELTNASPFPIDLENWDLEDEDGDRTELPSVVLKPDSFLIVCADEDVGLYSHFGNVAGVSGFPSMNTTGSTVILKNKSGKLIHAVKYSKDTYGNEIKEDGGYTLEMIDAHQPCLGDENWKASNDPSGGTPGKINTVHGSLDDAHAPSLVRAYPSGDAAITLVFSEPMDSASLVATTNYQLDNGLQPVSISAASPFYDQVVMSLNTNISAGKIYNITVSNAIDCAGNSIGENNTVPFAIPNDAEASDIVINEILFNPEDGGVDYVEIFNRSSKVIDLSSLYLANKDNNEPADVTQLTSQHILIFPGEYHLLTEDAEAVLRQYISEAPGTFLQMNSFPSYADDGGEVLLMNTQGIVDEVDYAEEWHFALLSNTEGVSLERIDPNGPSTRTNFHSAATSAGYGTPGFQNSQYGISEIAKGLIRVVPEVFSPDNDGMDDFVTIHYEFPQPGYLTNIKIFDAAGRMVRILENNSLSGLKGYYRWDGLDAKGQQLPQGMYILYTEILSVDGNKKMFKNVVVLARKY